MQALKAILFDHDGTLVDSEAVHCQLWLDVLKPYGVSFSEDDYIRRYSGMPTIANARDLVARFALPVSAEDLSARKIAVAAEFLTHNAFPLMPQARAILDHFAAQGLVLAVVTGAGHDAVRASLRAHGLLERFATVVSCDDVAHSKPAPDCYLLAAQRLGLSPAECIAIEDTEHGLVAAADAGVPCIAIPNAMSAHHDFSRATVILPDLQAARAWVEGRFGIAQINNNC